MTLPDPTLDQLRLFVLVAETGSFSATARRIHRAQSAVSYGIANLERTLNVTLFDRSQRTPTLTPHGEHLLPHAIQVLHTTKNLCDHATALHTHLEPEVHVCVDAICPASLLITLGTSFQRTFPNTQLRIHTEVLEDVQQRILDDSCQLAIAGPKPLQNHTLQRTLLTHIPVVCVVSSHHPLASLPTPPTQHDLRQHTQIVIHNRTPSPSQYGVLSATPWGVADASTKLQMIRAGLGWGHLPLEMVQNDLDNHTLTTLHLDAWDHSLRSVPLFLVTSNIKPLHNAALWMYNHLKHIAQTSQPHTTHP